MSEEGSESNELKSQDKEEEDTNVKKAQNCVKVTPWTSWEEWIDVYKNIFANDIKSWKRAYDQISVWKARISTISSGIESTLPLIHAQIALADNSLDVSYKNASLNMAIIRFVTIIAQGVNENPGKSRMHEVAFNLKLPSFLVHLRHAIIHSDSVFGTSLTLKNALEIAFTWIKAHYWNKEYERLMKEAPKEAETTRAPVKRKLEEDKEKTNRMNKKRKYAVERFQPLLDRFVSSILRNDNTALSTSLKNRKGCRKFLCILHSSFPDLASNVICSLIFCSKKIEEYYKKALEGKHKRLKNCSCQSRLPDFLIENLSRVLRPVIEFLNFKEFLKEFIRKAQEMPSLSSEWIYIFFNWGIPLSEKTKQQPTNHCPVHTFSCDNSVAMRESDWKEILYDLFCLSSPRSSELALDIAEWSGLVKKGSSLQNLRNLVTIYAQSKAETTRSNGMKVEESTMTKAIATVDDILYEVKVKSPAEFPRVENIAQSIGEHSIDFSKYRSTLGVLPHQFGDTQIYKKLILQDSSQPHT